MPVSGTGIILIIASNEGATNEGNILFALLQRLKKSIIPKCWNLMDTGSTLDLISNVELLTSEESCIHSMQCRMSLDQSKGLSAWIWRRLV